MARKKRVKRVSRKAPRRKIKRVVRSKSSSSKFFNIKNKFSLVLNNFLLFVALSLVSFVLFRFIQNNFLMNLFFIMAIIFGFVAASLLIVLIILFVIKIVSKK
jgi:hypothetical protein